MIGDINIAFHQCVFDPATYKPRYFNSAPLHQNSRIERFRLKDNLAVLNAKAVN